jgi:hypothetical protein
MGRGVGYSKHTEEIKLEKIQVEKRHDENLLMKLILEQEKRELI